jgi:DNA-binding NtrC family response regulator
VASASQGDRTEPAEAGALSAAEDALRERAALLLHHGGGVSVAMLEPGVSIAVGRDAPSALVVPDRTLSRTHARFTLTGRRVRVEDLGSTNGTWLAGQRVASADLSAGQEVKLGSVLARVHFFEQEGAAASAAAPRADGDDAIVIGRAMEPLFETAARVADSRLSVLIQGETGSGKEVLARYLHRRSPRAQRPFLAVNCGAIPQQLVESTLFGHERGAFTGAVQQHKGVFESAHGGTVLLDEIGELAAPAQAALLVVLESGRFCRVGGAREIAVDVRVIAASHRDVARMVDEGSFRADLYYRLQGAVIRVPPLRERRDEIPRLAASLVARANAQHGRSVAGIADDAMEALASHEWPGNVRELRNVVDRAVVLAKGPLVTLEDVLPLGRASAAPQGGPSATARPSDGAKAQASDGTAPLASESAPPRADTPEEDDLDGPVDLRAQVDGYEARLSQRALAKSGYRRAEAARRLGLPLRTLARRIKLLGIKEPR